jgi:hypothetical protein
MINFGNFVILDVLTAVTIRSNISGMGCHVVWCMHSKHSACCLLGILFHPEDRCMFLCNISELPSDYAISHPEDSTLGTYFDRLARTTAILESQTNISISIYPGFYSPLLGLGRFFSFLNFYTVGRTLWTGDQPVI